MSNSYDYWAKLESISDFDVSSPVVFEVNFIDFWSDESNRRFDEMIKKHVANWAKEFLGDLVAGQPIWNEKWEKGEMPKWDKSECWILESNSVYWITLVKTPHEPNKHYSTMPYCER